MKARDVVNALIRKNPDIDRADLVEQINDVHRLVLGGRMVYNRAYDSTTGVDPKITPTTVVWDLTVDGTPDTQASWIDRVYQTDYKVPLDVGVYGTTINFKDSQLGGEYYVRYYREPDEILAESDTLQIPDEFFTTFVIGVQHWINYFLHGEDNKFVIWEARDMKKMQWKMNKQYNVTNSRIGDDTKSAYTPYSNL